MSDDAPIRPSSLDPITVDAMTPAAREAAGPALAEVRSAERVVREVWAMLCDLWPATAGTRERLRLLVRRAQALVEGRDARLARVVRTQPVPWQLADEPLAGALRQADDVVAGAHAVRSLVAGTRRLRERYDALRERVVPELPRAWARWVERRGVAADAIDGARSEEEVAMLAERLALAERELTRWRGEVEAWVAGRSGEVSGDAPGAPWAILEERYDVLVALGAVDRAPLQARAAAGLRRVVREHLRVLSVADPRFAGSVAARVAGQYAMSSTEPNVSAEEAWSYLRAALGAREAR